MNIKTFLTGALVLGGLLAVGGGLAYWKYRGIQEAMNAPPMPEMPESVRIVEARSIQYQPTARLSGTVIALQSVVVSNEVAGTVKEVLFESGASVEAGQVLVLLDTSTEEADLAAAEAFMRVAEASIRTADSDLAWSDANYRRMVQASEAKVVPVADLDKSRTDLEGNRARVERAKAELEQAAARATQVKTMIAKKTLKAPFKGTLGLRNVHPGQYIQEGTNIVGLQSDTDEIYLDFALPQEQAFRVKPGDVVVAKSDVFGDKPLSIGVVALDAVADAETRNIRVRSIVSNKDRKLRPGMFVDVSVPVGNADSYIAVPVTAIRRASYGDHVFMAVAGEQPNELRARQRFVKLGPIIGEDVIVTDGVAVGDRLASIGSFKLRENALLIPITDQGAPAGAAGSAPAGGSGTAGTGAASEGSTSAQGASTDSKTKGS
jgi:membrane fusion protein (multidrug efflux system)